MRRLIIVLVEVVALMPAQVLLVPLLAYGMLVTLGTMSSLAPSPGHPPLSRLSMLGSSVILWLVIVSAVAGLLGAWTAVVVGADWLRRWAPARWTVVVCLLMGVGAGGYWEVGILASPSAVASTVGWILWCALLVPPLAVAVHQLYLLLRPALPAASD